MKSLRQRQRRCEVPSLLEAPTEAPPAILRAITDPKIRPKVERISQELSNRGLSKDVRYGIDGPTFDIVKELLEVTR